MTWVLFNPWYSGVPNTGNQKNGNFWIPDNLVSSIQMSSLHWLILLLNCSFSYNGVYWIDLVLYYEILIIEDNYSQLIQYDILEKLVTFMAPLAFVCLVILVKRMKRIPQLMGHFCITKKYCFKSVLENPLRK